MHAGFHRLTILLTVCTLPCRLTKEIRQLKESQAAPPTFAGGFKDNSSGEYAMLAGKPILGYRWVGGKTEGGGWRCRQDWPVYFGAEAAWKLVWAGGRRRSRQLVICVFICVSLLPQNAHLPVLLQNAHLPVPLKTHISLSSLTRTLPFPCALLLPFSARCTPSHSQRAALPPILSALHCVPSSTADRAIPLPLQGPAETCGTTPPATHPTTRRCMACDRPLDKLDDRPGPYIPTCQMPLKLPGGLNQTGNARLPSMPNASISPEPSQVCGQLQCLPKPPPTSSPHPQARRLHAPCAYVAVHTRSATCARCSARLPPPRPSACSHLALVHCTLMQRMRTCCAGEGWPL